MASAPTADEGADIFDRFLADRGHKPAEEWERDYQKKQCPDCGGLHDLAAASCASCGWAPMS